MVNIYKSCSRGGFTIVEIIIVITVIAILATIGTLSYFGVRKDAVKATVLSDLKNAISAVDLEASKHIDDADYSITALPDNFRPSPKVTVELNPSEPYYGGLTAVQNGVLFWTVCEELLKDPYYTIIHDRDGGSSTMMFTCSDNVLANNILITSWSSKSWGTPVTELAISSYIDSLPDDATGAWWVDKQAVYKRFYHQLVETHKARGGQFPITSFWDPWANQWSGVKKEELPPLVDADPDGYCIEAFHSDYPDMIFKITSDDSSAELGSC